MPESNPKFLVIFILLFVFGLNLYAQKDSTATTELPNIYIGLSAGTNNKAGVFGVNVDYVLDDNTLIGLGFGTASWGYKTTISLQSHPKHFRKFYYGVGITATSGKKDFISELELKSEDLADVTLDLLPITNLDIFVGNSWKFGKCHRFYIEAGYALRLTEINRMYEITDEYVKISSVSQDALRAMAPGGVMIAAGLSFGL